MLGKIDAQELQLLWASVKLLRQTIRDGFWVTASGTAEAITKYANHNASDPRLGNIAREALEFYHLKLNERDTKGVKRVD